MTVAADTFRPVAILDIPLWAAAVAWASQRRVEFALNHRLDEITYPLAQPDFDRVKPLVEKSTVVSASGCRADDVVLVLVMA